VVGGRGRLTVSKQAHISCLAADAADDAQRTKHSTRHRIIKCHHHYHNYIALTAVSCSHGTPFGHFKNIYYRRQGGYVVPGICLFVCLLQFRVKTTH